MDSEELYSVGEYKTLGPKISEEYNSDSLDLTIIFSLKKSYPLGDSIIQTFGLNIRVGED